MRELLEQVTGGGVRGGWENLKAADPGGRVLCRCCQRTICSLDGAIMDFDWLRENKSFGFGHGGRMIVMDREHGCDQSDLAFVQVLQARELWPMYAVPRRYGLDDACNGSFGTW